MLLRASKTDSLNVCVLGARVTKKVKTPVLLNALHCQKCTWFYKTLGAIETLVYLRHCVVQ